jgi:hypothetical protein
LQPWPAKTQRQAPGPKALLSHRYSWSNPLFTMQAPPPQQRPASTSIPWSPPATLHGWRWEWHARNTNCSACNTCTVSSEYSKWLTRNLCPLGNATALQLFTVLSTVSAVSLFVSRAAEALPEMCNLVNPRAPGREEA